MSAVAPPALKLIADRVDNRLERLLTAELDRWSSLDPDLFEPMAEIRRLVLTGGKRLRPAFCTWAYVGLGGAVDDNLIVDTGAAFELMHAFALFHDDVMDDADSRRGVATTHTVFAAKHEQERWVGEPRRFGEGIAILIGDLAFVYSDMLLAGANSTAWQIWNEMRIEVNVGQVLDVLGSVRGLRDVAQAERVATYKSAKYTVERPLHLGAALADPDGFAMLSEQFSAYGLPLGLAFQMRDDVMGVFGDTSTTGKPVGNDLREGKPTPLLARAIAAADETQRAELAHVGQPDLTAETVAAIQQVIVDTGALAELEASIERLTDESLVALDRLDITPEATSELAQLAAYVGERET